MPILTKFSQGVSIVKPSFVRPGWAVYFEFIFVLCGLYLAKYFYDGQIGFAAWLLHPSIPLVGIFAARYGLISGLGTFSVAFLMYIGLELPVKSLGVSNFDYLAEVLVLPALMAIAALLFGILHNRSANRIVSLESELADCKRQNEELRRFTDEACNSLKRNDAVIAFGNTRKAIGIYRALDGIYLSDRGHFEDDLTNVLSGLSPGIEFAFLDAKKKIVSKSRGFDPQALELVGKHAEGSRGPMRKTAANDTKVCVRAPFQGHVLVPSATTIALSCNSGLAPHDLEICLRVICRNIAGGPMGLSLDGDLFGARSSIA